MSNDVKCKKKIKYTSLNIKWISNSESAPKITHIWSIITKIHSINFGPILYIPDLPVDSRPDLPVKNGG